jgi:hypothetical protein
MTEPGQPCVHDQRQRVLVPGPDVDEVDLDPVDLGRELRQRVELRLRLAPVVVGLPVARELLQRRQLHALRPIFDKLPARPARRRDAPAQVVKLLLWNLDVERPDLGGGLDGAAHDDFLSRSDLNAAPGSAGLSDSESRHSVAPPSEGMFSGRTQ